eukprot:PhM_4_TR16122/c7_g1_i1/m.101357
MAVLFGQQKTMVIEPQRHSQERISTTTTMMMMTITEEMKPMQKKRIANGINMRRNGERCIDIVLSRRTLFFDGSTDTSSGQWNVFTAEQAQTTSTTILPTRVGRCHQGHYQRHVLRFTENKITFIAFMRMTTWLCTEETDCQEMIYHWNKGKMK